VLVGIHVSNNSTARNMHIILFTKYPLPLFPNNLGPYFAEKTIIDICIVPSPMPEINPITKICKFSPFIIVQNAQWFTRWSVSPEKPPNSYVCA
jgi:hypothetical protein